MSIRVEQPGMLTTVQDLGRRGHQQEGVPVSGAMDRLAHRVANMLVGNDENAAALEITLLGPSLTFTTDTLIAIGGADLGAHAGSVDLPPWRPAWVPARTRLGFSGRPSGCRAYLAVGGGIDTPMVLGSRSTFIRGGFGGVNGRALQRGDVLTIANLTPLSERITAKVRSSSAHVSLAHWSASPLLRPAYGASVVVHLLSDVHTPLLTDGARERLFGSEFRLASQSDRMGLRLDGPVMELSQPTELLSEGVAFGTVQLPPGGAPIILMADRQTTGGYPRIACVASIDLPLVAQLRPGDRLRFQPISLREAQAMYIAREQDLAQARVGIALRHP